MKEIEKKLKIIESRNKRVEADKAWETSWTRKVVIFALTYIVIVIFFYYTKLPNPLLNSILRVIWVKDTRRAVTDVPILAPIIMGIAFVTFSAPPATKPTTIDVVEEDDCMIEVTRIPIKRPTKGLVVVSINVSARSFPNIFNDVPISSRLNKKRYKKKIKNRELNKVMCFL